MTAVSAIPAVTDKVIAVATAALTGVTILDGPLPGNAAEGNYLAVGAAEMRPDSDGTDAVDSSMVWRSTGPTAQENLTLLCVARSWNGNGDQKSARDAAFTTVNALVNAWKTDPTWGGVVLDSAGPSRIHQRNGQNNAGAWTEVAFDLSFRALL